MTFTLALWPKIPHLYREVTITEKINGSNNAVHFDESGNMAVQSRTRFITPDNDNQHFARWAEENKESLFADLGVGIHFGEWWGYKIGPGYDCKPAERYFSLFNTRRWADSEFTTPDLRVVPVLFEGTLKESTIGGIIHFWTDALRSEGSFAKPGFMRPEGIVIYHKDSDQMFKIFLEKDEKPKSLH